jgi:hypothetical protein
MGKPVVPRRRNDGQRIPHDNERLVISGLVGVGNVGGVADPC